MLIPSERMGFEFEHLLAKLQGSWFEPSCFFSHAAVATFRLKSLDAFWG